MDISRTVFLLAHDLAETLADHPRTVLCVIAAANLALLSGAYVSPNAMQELSADMPLIIQAARAELKAYPLEPNLGRDFDPQFPGTKAFVYRLNGPGYRCGDYKVTARRPAAIGGIFINYVRVSEEFSDCKKG